LVAEGKDVRHEAFLKVSGAGMLDSVQRRVSNHLVNRSERWNIVEYWPSVTQDTYRIRSLIGGALEVNPDLNRLLIGIVRRDHHQEARNGSCTISLHTADNKVFLGWNRDNDGNARLAMSPTPVQWLIRNLGEYTYSITFDFPADGVISPLALSVVDDEIAHNKVWFMEHVYALTPLLARHPEIPSGVYAPRNVETGQYFIFLDTPVWHAEPSPTKSVQITITYTSDNINMFRISQSTSPTFHLGFGGNTATEVVDGSENASLWVLERGDDPNGGFFY
ncbi:hypothetical protein DXG01_009215, partial [Tephrocybe rancida]